MQFLCGQNAVSFNTASNPTDVYILRLVSSLNAFKLDTHMRRDQSSVRNRREVSLIKILLRICNKDVRKARILSSEYLYSNEDIKRNVHVLYS
jgi:hypothetical protein